MHIIYAYLGLYIIIISFKEPKYLSIEKYLNYGVFSQWNTRQLPKVMEHINIVCIEIHVPYILKDKGTLYKKLISYASIFENQNQK